MRSDPSQSKALHQDGPSSGWRILHLVGSTPSLSPSLGWIQSRLEDPSPYQAGSKPCTRMDPIQGGGSFTSVWIKALHWDGSNSGWSLSTGWIHPRSDPIQAGVAPWRCHPLGQDTHNDTTKLPLREGDSQGCQGTSLENPHSQKQKKKPEKWRQAGVSNPKVLVFIQTRAQHCSVPNAPKPFCLREIYISTRRPEPRGIPRGGKHGAQSQRSPSASVRPQLLRLPWPSSDPPRTNSKIHSVGFCQLPEFRNPPPQRCRGEGGKGCSSSPTSDSAHGNPVLN